MSDIFAEVTPFAGDPPYATVLDYFSLRVDAVRWEHLSGSTQCLRRHAPLEICGSKIPISTGGSRGFEPAANVKVGVRGKGPGSEKAWQQGTIVAKVLNFGHRGAAEVPENTIPSFRKALEQGADGLELDVRKTADGKLVVIHPSVVEHHSVQSSSYEDIRKLPDGFEIPLLKDVLAKFGKKTFLDVEFKVPGFEEEAIALITKHGDPSNTMISAFDTDTLNKVHDLSPALQLGYIYNRTQDEESRHNAPIDYVIPQFRLASRELISEVHDEELKVMAWTVNDEAEMKRLLTLGVDGIITDYPAVLANVLNSKA